MAFLFKSKKHQERATAGGRDGSIGSQGSIQSPDARARVVRDEKANVHRATPTGSLNSLDNDGSNASPDQTFAPGSLRRAQTGDPTPQTANDMQPQVSNPWDERFTVELCCAPCHCCTTSLNQPLLLTTPCYTDAHRSCPNKSQLFAISLVATQIKLHIPSSRALPSLWRCRERNSL